MTEIIHTDTKTVPRDAIMVLAQIKHCMLMNFKQLSFMHYLCCLWLMEHCYLFNIAVTIIIHLNACNTRSIVIINCYYI